MLSFQGVQPLKTNMEPGAIKVLRFEAAAALSSLETSAMQVDLYIFETTNLGQFLLSREIPVTPQ